MNNFFIDSSVWIDFFKGKDSAVSNFQFIMEQCLGRSLFMKMRNPLDQIFEEKGDC